eukprot:501201-Prymnesium_polylepis.1
MNIPDRIQLPSGSIVGFDCPKPVSRGALHLSPLGAGTFIGHYGSRHSRRGFDCTLLIVI